MARPLRKPDGNTGQFDGSVGEGYRNPPSPAPQPPDVSVSEAGRKPVFGNAMTQATPVGVPGRYEAWVVNPGRDLVIHRPTYLTDGDCGFCREAMDRALRMFPNTFEAIPYWEGPLDELGLDLDRCYEAGHLVVPTSEGYRVMPGSLSWAGVLELQPNRFWRACGRLMQHQPVRWVGEKVYRWVAKNRRHLGKQACAMPQR